MNDGRRLEADAVSEALAKTCAVAPRAHFRQLDQLIAWFVHAGKPAPRRGDPAWRAAVEGLVKRFDLQRPPIIYTAARSQLGCGTVTAS